MGGVRWTSIEDDIIIQNYNCCDINTLNKLIPNRSSHAIQNRASHLKCSNKSKYLKLSYEHRFWSLVNKTNECWYYTGTNRGNGYGCFEINGKLISVHRFSWELHYGLIPNGLFVLHKCDNPSCVRPDHLFLGTADDNNKDRARKNRSCRLYGEDSSQHKLYEIDIIEIRKAYSAGEISQKELGHRYGVCQWTIGKIVNRITWNHI